MLAILIIVFDEQNIRPTDADGLYGNTEVSIVPAQNISNVRCQAIEVIKLRIVYIKNETWNS